jgi:predicted ATPase
MVREEPSRELLDTLADHLRNRHLLLVLDNSEQVTEAGLAVVRLLDAAPRLTVLATSRVPLHVSGEREYQVPPLTLPDVSALSNLDVIARSEAVALLAERAAAVRPGFRVTAANASAMAEITARLDGLPLAIELAASRLKVLSPRALRDRLGHRLSLLSGGNRDLPERQRTLRGTIEWSHDLLNPEEQHLFARLAVFVGGWTLEAGEAICADGLELEVLDGLGSLLDQSLVRQEETQDGEMRFFMLETIREYATERLAESGKEEEIRHRHAEHFRYLAEEAELHLIREDRILWLARLEAEHDNLRAALDWAKHTENPETGLRTAAAIWRFWLQRGHLSEGRARLEELLSMASTESSLPVWAGALGALGGIAYWQNDYPPMRAAYQEAIEIARKVGDPKLLASALLNLSFIPYVDQDADRAEVILQEGLTAAEEAGDPVLIAEFWRSIAFLDVVRGNPAGAIEPGRIAIKMLRDEGAAWKVADSLGGLGMIMRLAGDLDAARGQLREALDMFAQSRDTLSVSMVLTGLALVANDDGLPERAAHLIGASARIRDDLGGGIGAEVMGFWGDPEDDAQRALGELAYHTARAEGYDMDTETAVAYALRNGD